jgi:hypothetical protein
MPALTLDPAATWAYVRRVARLDDSVFGDIARDESATLAALLLPVVLMFGGAVAGLLYILVEGGGAQLNWTQFVLREMVLGSGFGWAAWLGWVALTRFTLLRMYAVEVDFWQLARALGFAMLPLALTWAFFLPAAVIDSAGPLGDVAFGVLTLGFVLVPIVGLHAVPAVTGGVPARAVVFGTVLPYLVVAAIVAVEGHFTGAAPMLPLYQQGSQAYFGIARYIIPQ